MVEPVELKAKLDVARTLATGHAQHQAERSAAKAALDAARQIRRAVALGDGKTVQAVLKGDTEGAKLGSALAAGAAMHAEDRSAWKVKRSLGELSPRDRAFAEMDAEANGARDVEEHVRKSQSITAAKAEARAFLQNNPQVYTPPASVMAMCRKGKEADEAAKGERLDPAKADRIRSFLSANPPRPPKPAKGEEEVRTRGRGPRM